MYGALCLHFDLSKEIQEKLLVVHQRLLGARKMWKGETTNVAAPESARRILVCDTAT